uniref:ATP synthase F0 subunit 8 n=1 Tax=Crenomytilus grayanus TaxID=151218 RepID=A0A516EZE8_CREGR|nr:ATP synthase F0 subunit 8 [Crenomytilus grayanus]QDO71878.1 ATP synthase F0 subunit 8 [Crenomytilus grayanus]
MSLKWHLCETNFDESLLWEGYFCCWKCTAYIYGSLVGSDFEEGMEAVILTKWSVMLLKKLT